jgi:thymidine kinase
MNNPTNTGYLEVICGSMFSGKSSLLIARLQREVIAKRKIQVFKPSIDTRYGLEAIVTHDARDLEQITKVKPTVVNTKDFKLYDKGTKIVGIEEVQFFDEKIIDIIDEMVNRENRKVIAVGLDLDYMGKPFGVIASLLAMADSVTKLTAICNVCSNDATRTFRKNIDHSKSQEQIVVGGVDLYEARCKECWLKGMEIEYK